MKNKKHMKFIEVLESEFDFLAANMVHRRPHRQVSPLYAELDSVAHRRKPDRRGLIFKIIRKGNEWRYHIVWPDASVSCCGEFHLFRARLE